MLLNHMEIKENFKIKINYIFTAKLVLANCLLIVAILGVMILSNSYLNTLLAIMLGIMVYLYSLYKLKIFNRRDLAMLKYKV